MTRMADATGAITRTQDGPELRDKKEGPVRTKITAQRSFAPSRDSFIPYSGSATCDTVRVLHIVPFTYFEKEYEFLGSCKDIDGRQQYLKQCGAPFDTFSHLKDRYKLIDEFSFFDLPDYTHVIVDLSKSAEELSSIRKKWPNAKLIIRSHNPEVSHRLDYFRAEQRLESVKGSRWAALSNVSLFYKRERGVVKYADTILHIETQNTVGYWRTLGFRGEVFTTPYYTTNRYLDATHECSQRNKQIVCLASSHPGPLIAEMVANFHCIVEAMDGRLPEFSFYATGDLPKRIRQRDISSRVRHLGVVDDVLALLNQTFAVAVTSDLGRGFKTKILEAIVCGAWVIVTPGLMKRMPDVLKPYCAVLDMENPGDSLTRIIDDLFAREWPTGDPNAVLREESYRALDAAIFGEAAKKLGRTTHA